MEEIQPIKSSENKYRKIFNESFERPYLLCFFARRVTWVWEKKRGGRGGGEGGELKKRVPS